MRSSTSGCAMLALVVMLAMPIPAQAEWRAVIDRVTTMATGTAATFGRGGLASDGANLWISDALDGVIQEYDLATLQLKRLIQTPLVRVWGLEYRDGIIYGGELRQGDVITNSSRINRISPTDGEVLSFFEAPENGVAELTFGIDGLLYAVDGFEGPSTTRTKIHSFNADTGALVSTAISHRIVEFGLTFDDFDGTRTIAPLPDGSFILNVGGGLFRGVIENGEIFRREKIDGLPDAFQGGSTLIGDRYLFVGIDCIGMECFQRIYEFRVVPEPSGAVLALTVFAVIAYLVWRKTPYRFRPF